MRYLTFLSISLFLFSNSSTSAGQGKPLIEDHQMAIAIQEEMEVWGDKVSISDAYTIMRILGFSQETHGGEDISSGKAELFHSKITYNKNTALTGMGVFREYIGKAFGNAQEFNAGFDFIGGITLSQKMPIYKFADLGKEGLIETQQIVGTYDWLPPKLDKYFKAVSYGSYCWHVGTTLYDLKTNGVQRSSTGSYIKLATGAIGVTATAIGGPVAVFVGGAIWIFEQSVDMIQAQSNKDEEELAYGDFKIFYLRYNDNKGVNWVNMMQTGGTWSEILTLLREYWKADFSGDKNGADKDTHRNLVKELYDNYEDRFAYRFVNEFIVPDIVSFLQREAERSKAEAITSLKEYIASLYDQKTIIRMQLAYQNLYGRKMDVYPPIKLTITDLYEKEEMDELQYDVKLNGPKVEIYVNKLEYLSWITKQDGRIIFKIETEKDGKVTKHLMSPNWIKPELGEDGDGHPVRTEFSERGMNIIVDVPIEVNIPSYQVLVQLVGLSGDKLDDGIMIQAPDGQRVETNNRGEALINVPTIGKSWVYEVDHYGGLNGGKALLPEKVNNISSPLRVVLKSLLYEKSPPMPVFPRLDISEIQDKVEKTILKLERGDTNIKSTKREIDRAVSSIEIKLIDYRNSYENSQNLYIKKASSDQIPQKKIADFLSTKREIFDQDHKQAWAYQKDIQKKFEKTQESWEEALDTLMSSIKMATENLNILTSGIAKDAEKFDINSARSTYYLTPHSFKELSIVENEMQTVDMFLAEMEDILGRAKTNLKPIKIQSLQLEGYMKDLTKIRETINFSKEDRRYRKAIDAIVQASFAQGVIEMFVDYGGIDKVIRQLEHGRSNLSWVQLRALEHIELMKEYEALIVAKPDELKETNPLFKKVDQLRLEIADVKASVAWAAGIEFRNRGRAFTNPESIPSRHNGFGVDAWPAYSKAIDIAGSTISDLNKVASISEKWSNDIDTLRKKLINQIQAMNKGGWIVEDIRTSMNDLLSTSLPGLHMEKSLKKETETFQNDVEILNKGFEVSIVTLVAPIKNAYKDAMEYKPILQNALKTAKSGNLKGSESALKAADALIPSLAKTPTNRGSADYREVLLDKESFDLEEELNNLLYTLRREAYEASLAHLSLDITGGTFEELNIKVYDENNNDVGMWYKNSCTLKSGRYKIMLTSLGNRIDPGEQMIDLAEGEHLTLPIKIEKPVNTGTGTSVSVVASDFDFNNIKKRVFTYNANLGMEAPSWSKDSKVVVAKTVDGLTAYDLQKNESWVVTATAPTRPPGWQDATIGASFPIVVNNSVVYQMGMSGYSLADRSQEMYWMVVPLEGGQPSAVFRELSGKFRVISTREKQGDLEYLLLGDINEQTGIFIQKAGSTDYREAEIVHSLKDWNVRLFVSNDWRLICIGDVNYQDGYKIYRVGGNLVTSFPQKFLHTLTFSPDNKYIAGHQRMDEAPWNRIVVVPINDLTRVSTVDADDDVVRFDPVAWSPNGRYLAYQRGVETDEIEKENELVVVDLTNKDNSLAVGNTITRARDQSTLIKTNNNTTDQVDNTSGNKTNTNSDNQNSSSEITTNTSNAGGVSTQIGKVTTFLNDDFSGSLTKWDLTNVNAEVLEGQLYWNEGNHQGVYSRSTIPLNNVIIEFDGCTTGNGITLEWKDENNNGYNVTLGAYYNTASHVGKIGKGAYDWSITRGAHLLPNTWQHYKIVLDDQSLKAYIDDKVIGEQVANTSLKGNGQIRISSYNTRVGIDNVRIYGNEKIKENKGKLHVMKMSCTEKDNDENGCCCFLGAHTYSFSQVKVQSFDAEFDTGRGTNCKSSVSIQINSDGQWTTVKKLEAVSGKGSSGANLIKVKVSVNSVIQGISISDGCTCCIDESKVTIYTEALDSGNDDNATLIINGGFEEPVIGSYQSFSTGQEIAGWKVVKEAVDLTGSYFKSSEGNQSLDLYGTPGIGAIEQTFKTKPYTSYRVTFDMAGNPYAPMIKELLVSAAGKNQNFVFDCTGKNTSNMGWLSQSWEFTASNTVTTLRFESLGSTGSGRYGPAIDNVKVVLLKSPEITNDNISVSNASLGTILWRYELPDEKVGIIGKTYGGDLGPRMALGQDGSVYYAAGGGRATWVETRIYAINKYDGSLKWKSEKLDAAGMNSHISVGEDGTIYAIGQMILYAFDPNNGSTKWTWQAPEKVDNKFTKYALAGIALSQNGDLIISAERGGTIYCLDSNGKLKWYNLDPQATPYSITIGPDNYIYSINNLYAPDYDGGLYLVSRDPESGKKRWVHKTGGGIGGGNNIVFDDDGYLIASFVDFGAKERKLHKIDPATGNIEWSSNFVSGQHGLYLGPDGYAYQVLNPPGEKTGIYRINLNNSNINMVNWSGAFGAIDDQNRLIHNFLDPKDRKQKLGAFSMEGTVSWKADIQGVDDRTLLISNDHIVYGRIGNQIIAIQSDAPLAQSGWPRLGGNNRNTFNAIKKMRMLK
jgi:choice-of-anchor C domain-containing protein